MAAFPPGDVVVSYFAREEMCFYRTRNHSTLCFDVVSAFSNQYHYLVIFWCAEGRCVCWLLKIFLPTGLVAT